MRGQAAGIRETARARRRLKMDMAPAPQPARPRRLPSREEAARYLLSFDLFRQIGRPEEGEEYVRQHLERLIRTLEFLPELGEGAEVLELGASPYFMTVLLKKHFRWSVTPANYFEDYGAPAGPEAESRISSEAFGETHTFRYKTFNIERDPFPYADASFDLVLCCEILEHLVMDPSHLLGEMHRVLKPGGYAFFSTPNVLNLEYVRRLLGGRNVFGSYSGYGVYGRHNREYTPGELAGLLREHHFEPAVHLADVYPHDRWHGWLTRWGKLSNRRDNLFAVGKAYGQTVQQYPGWLYAHQWGRPRVLRDAIVMGQGETLQLGRGWHNFEDWPPGIRWTGREAEAFLRAPTAAESALKLRAFGGPRGASGEIVLNGGPAQPFALAPDGPWEVSVPLPPSLAADAPGRLEIRLTVAHPFVPSAEGAGTDNRELGIAVERLWLSC